MRTRGFVLERGGSVTFVPLVPRFIDTYAYAKKRFQWSKLRGRAAIPSRRYNPPFRILNRRSSPVIKDDYHTAAREPTVFRNRYPRCTRLQLLLITVASRCFSTLLLVKLCLSLVLRGLTFDTGGRQWAEATRRARNDSYAKKMACKFIYWAKFREANCRLLCDITWIAFIKSTMLRC